MNLPDCYQCKQPPKVHDGGTYITCRTCGIEFVSRDAAHEWREMQAALREEDRLERILKPCRNCGERPGVMIGGGEYVITCDCTTMITDAPSKWEARQEGTR